MKFLKHMFWSKRNWLVIVSLIGSAAQIATPKQAAVLMGVGTVITKVLDYNSTP